MDQFVQSGQYLSGRYQLTRAYDQQLPYKGTELWAATDKLLGTEVRVLMLAPQIPVKQAVLDAARRSALVDGARLIRVLSVSDSADSVFVATEVPVGRNFASFLDGTPLRADQVHAIIGSLAQTLAAARQRGLRHLHITPESLWITPSNEVYVDGIGMAAALSNTQSPDMTPAEADRLEVRRLLGFAASLLTGSSLSDPDDVDTVIANALARQDVSPELRQALNGELDGLSEPLASTLAKKLAPTPTLDPAHFLDPHAARFFPTEQIRAVDSASDDAGAEPPVVPPSNGAKAVSAPSTDSPEPPTTPHEQVGPDADPSKTARFPKITAPLGGVAAVGIAGGADTTEVTPAAEADTADAATADTRSFDDVISAGSASSPAPGLNPTVSAGFAAGLAEAAQTQGLAGPGSVPTSSEDAADSAHSPVEAESEVVDGSGESDVDPELGIVPPPAPGLAPQWVKPDEFAREMQDDPRSSSTEPNDVAKSSGGTENLRASEEQAVENIVEPSETIDEDEPIDPAEPVESGEDVEIDETKPDPADSEVVAGKEVPEVTVEPTTSTARPEFDESPVADDPYAAHVSTEDFPPMEATPEGADANVDPHPTIQFAPVTVSSGEAPAIQPTAALPSQQSVTPAHPVGGFPGAPHRASASPDPMSVPARGAGGPGGGRPARPGNPGGSGKKYNPSKVITFGAFILVAVALIWAVSTLFSPTSTPNITKPAVSAPATAPSDSEEPTTSQTPEPEPTQELPPPAISNVTLLNPQGAQLDPSNVAEQDSPATVPNTWDGNPGTAWRSWWYTNPSFVGKEGIGLEIQLAAEANVSEVVLNVDGQGGNVQWRNTTASAPNGGDVITEGAMGAETVLQAGDPLKTSTVILWFNSLPTDSEGQYRISISEVQVR